MDILTETRKMITDVRAAGKPVDKMTLPLTRLHEFLLAAASNRRLTTNEIEQMRQSALRGEAKVWGVSVEFE